MRLYHDKRIHEHFGISVHEYLSQTMDMIEIMNRLSDEYNIRHDHDAGNLDKQLKKITS